MSSGSIDKSSQGRLLALSIVEDADDRRAAPSTTVRISQGRLLAVSVARAGLSKSDSQGRLLALSVVRAVEKPCYSAASADGSRGVTIIDRSSPVAMPFAQVFSWRGLAFRVRGVGAAPVAMRRSPR